MRIRISHGVRPQRLQIQKLPSVPVLYTILKTPTRSTIVGWRSMYHKMGPTAPPPPSPMHAFSTLKMRLIEGT